MVGGSVVSDAEEEYPPEGGYKYRLSINTLHYLCVRVS